MIIAYMTWKYIDEGDTGTETEINLRDGYREMRRTLDVHGLRSIYQILLTAPVRQHRTKNHRNLGQIDLHSLFSDNLISIFTGCICNMEPIPAYVLDRIMGVCRNNKTTRLYNSDHSFDEDRLAEWIRIKLLFRNSYV